jgi:glutamine amidotransferase-like uncharacterized protein
MSARRQVGVALIAGVLLTSCGHHELGSAAILLFDGAGVSRGSVSALREVLDANHLSYATVNSVELNLIDEAALRRHQLLIVPGGNFIDIGNGIARGTALNIRNAVQHGMNYLGVCAGAFLAGNPVPTAFNLTGGARFRFYSAEEKGIRKAAVAITLAEGLSLDHYWEDGPQLSGWGEVVAKYPDGTPAVVQGAAGSGWVVLTGIHPEAPETWRQGLKFTTPVSDDNAYAAKLIRAALEQKPLPHY